MQNNENTEDLEDTVKTIEVRQSFQVKNNYPFYFISCFHFCLPCKGKNERHQIIFI